MGLGIKVSLRRSSLSVTRACPSCGKPAGNPLSHRCTTRTDWRRRLARDRRSKAAAKKKAARAAAAAKRKAARASRPAKPPHDYRACRDGDCTRRACVGFKDGWDEGYDEGFPDGVQACPLGHI